MTTQELPPGSQHTALSQSLTLSSSVHGHFEAYFYVGIKEKDVLEQTKP